MTTRDIIETGHKRQGRWNYIIVRMEPEMYDKLDALVEEHLGVKPSPFPMTRRAYPIPLSCGAPGFRLNAFGAIRRLEEKGVDWKTELGMRVERTK